MRPIRIFVAAMLVATSALPAQQAAQGASQTAPRRRQVVPMDSNRASQLSVSNRPEDHPVEKREEYIRERHVKP